MDDHTNISMNTTKKMKMKMNLYWGKNAIVLFANWPNFSLGMYILSLIVVFLLALLCELLSHRPTLKRGTSPLAGGLYHSVFFFFHIGLHYLVMLAVMSFNIGILLAAMLGHTLGFLIVKYRAIHSANKDPNHVSSIHSDPKV